MSRCNDDSCDQVHCGECGCHTVGNTLRAGLCEDCGAIRDIEEHAEFEKNLKGTMTMSETKIDHARVAQDIYELQDACNMNILSVAPKIKDAINDDSNAFLTGTDAKNRHPFVILYLDKCCDLADYPKAPESFDIFGHAYDYIRSLAEGNMPDRRQGLLTYYTKIGHPEYVK